MRSTRQKIEDKAKRQHLTEIAEEHLGRKIPATTNKATPSRYIFCPDIGYSELQNLKYGRFAFNGINPEIAKIQTEEESIRLQKKNPKLRNDEDIFKDIQDEEMAQSTFAKARQGRGVFIEPADKVLNIYTEETDTPEPKESTNTANNSETSNGNKPSQRYEPYRGRGQNNYGNRGGRGNNRGRGNFRGGRGNFNNKKK